MHPLIIKPTSLGSSLGMSTVTDFVNLKKQVKKLLEKDITLMVEEFVKGEEVSVSVIENMRGEELYVPIPIHIKHDKQFFDQEVKESGKFINQPMINFTESQRKFLIEAARFIHKKLHLRHFSRVDFIVTPKKVYFLEVNTVPGMTEGSILPASLKESGISMKEFISHLLEEAMSSFKKK
jgi:D-alanine-D-alanine ligase